jgi:hypothetical protein
VVHVKICLHVILKKTSENRQLPTMETGRTLNNFFRLAEAAMNESRLFPVDVPALKVS